MAKHDVAILRDQFNKVLSAVPLPVAGTKGIGNCRSEQILNLGRVGICIAARERGERGLLVVVLLQQ